MPVIRGRSRASSSWWRGAIVRARRRDRFVSVIAGLTLTGIALGVVALIVVTSVMNGFNSEIVSKLLWPQRAFSGLSDRGALHRL